ncbi:MAG: integrin alpha, partial [Alphaproteobacteria bacterium]|nr:integrin alpha [Alphaproteobacteria bacterium]
LVNLGNVVHETGGYDDFLIGGGGKMAASDSGGQAYLIYGDNTKSFPGEVDVNALSSTEALVLKSEYEDLGSVAASIGDVNGDGVHDLAVAAVSGGKVFVLFGSADGAGGIGSINGGKREINLDAIEADQGLVITSATGDGFGAAIDGVGDVNGDGFDDLLIGAPLTDVDVTGGPGLETGVGSVYLVFGNTSIGTQIIDTIDPTKVTRELDVSSFSEAQGRVFHGGDAGYEFGSGLAGLGDSNNDGFMDFIVGAPGAPSGDVIGIGEAYVFYGFDYGG